MLGYIDKHGYEYYKCQVCNSTSTPTAPTHNDIDVDYELDQE